MSAATLKKKPIEDLVIEPIKTNFFGFDFLLHTDQKYHKNILKYGAHEKHVLFFLRDIACMIGIKDLCFVDINNSDTSRALYLSRYAKKVISFYPHDVIYNQASEIIETNKIKNIDIKNYALSNIAKDMPFWVQHSNSSLGSESFVRDYCEENKYYMDVENAIGDEELSKETSVDIISINSSGSLKKVLSGLSNTIKKNSPVILFNMTEGDYKEIEDQNAMKQLFGKQYILLYFDKWGDESGEYVLEEMKFGMLSHFVAMPVEILKEISLNF